jgi:Fe-S cluster biogenesis protein NfuA
MSTQGLTITPESTPNPNSIKFKVNRVLVAGAGRDFPDAEAAKQSPLAQELFLINGVRGVFIGSNFVTVSMTADNVWGMRPLVEGTIETHLAAGKPVVTGGDQPVTEPVKPGSMIEAGILRVLENEIRPAVAMDGGDITFSSYENGIVKLHLRGSCHSCPSAVVTLKSGIENRLKQEFPEIVGVEAV